MADGAADTGWRAAARDLAVTLRFYSRLPVPVLPFEADPHGPPDFARAARMVPVAGAILGAVAGLALAVSAAIGLPPLACGLIAIGAGILASGAFHEDGLADTADGFGGGSTRERKLEIMKDSRIGTYGGVALVLSVALRAVLIAEIMARAGLPAAVCVLVASGAISRAAALWLGVALAPARPDGAAFAAGRPSRTAFLTAGGIAALTGFALLTPTLGILAPAAALAAAALAAYLTGRLALRQIGGQTGDVAGAAQQLAETSLFVACLLVIGLSRTSP